MIEQTPTIAGEIARLTAEVTALKAAQPTVWQQILVNLANTGVLLAAGLIAYFGKKAIERRDNRKEVEYRNRIAARERSKRLKVTLEDFVSRAERLETKEAAETLLKQCFSTLGQHRLRGIGTNDKVFEKWESLEGNARLYSLTTHDGDRNGIRKEIAGDLRSIHIPDEVSTLYL